ncbi:hypothetical protein [Chitinivibrio alkaliphilus]|uniref:UDP-N-acetylglucosamine pyrophosphorylase n=1 Tax=Chitinivibrio alkaliphilus ACht1 TaxID=1313304 RepID=U7D6L5_9BACT|nr:hypothetical protein [Chitinivibrio alkaliphilus]ERP32159.1 hypothetical protein CALK_0888 [Chitinivibrio alkaliphilus ACht1]
MHSWTQPQLQYAIHNYAHCSPELQERIAHAVTEKYSYEAYVEEVAFKKEALCRLERTKSENTALPQGFPPTMDAQSIETTPKDLSTSAVLIMAGGAGERLKQSLLAEGYSPEDLTDFTKATFPLPGRTDKAGTLELTLTMIRRFSPEIPVIVTTGPVGSTTARVIPDLLSRNNNFGLSNLQVLPQNERLHLTHENKIAWVENHGTVQLITSPDETGGPIMKLKSQLPKGEMVLTWLRNLGRTKTIVLQGTAVYRPEILPLMASAGTTCDALGIGISRTSFPQDDPYGSFVERSRRIYIIEKDARTPHTYSLCDPAGKHLPFNTGFYVFSNSVLAEKSLPPFAVRDKEVLPDLPHAAKTGYAATDLLPLVDNSRVLTIPAEDFTVIKQSSDLPTVARAAEEFGL